MKKAAKMPGSERLKGRRATPAPLDVGTDAPRPAPEGAPRKLADIPEAFRKPSKPPTKGASHG